MPRQRKYLKGKNWNHNSKRKFRIGTRKDGVSALSMTTKQLLAVIANEDKAKYHSNAVAVLKYRGNLNQ